MHHYKIIQVLVKNKLTMCVKSEHNSNGVKYRKTLLTLEGVEKLQCWLAADRQKFSCHCVKGPLLIFIFSNNCSVLK